jgi:tetratricopeptide (TPR) repeat protein
LAKRFPEVRAVTLATLHAQIALTRNDSSKAIEILRAAPFEFSNPSVRGEAYLAARQGVQAAAEFQKILDQRGLWLNDPIGALAHLGLARAYVLQGDIPKAKAAYQDFLTLWKDADPDIPIFIAAKAEYAKLQ